MALSASWLDKARALVGDRLLVDADALAAYAGDEYCTDEHRAAPAAVARPVDEREVAAIVRCVNPECRHEYFRPFSCKGFFLCPSCSQKRTLLFAEYLDEQLLLALPHRQFVFTLPTALRVFLRHDQRMFAELARLIFTLITQFYSAAAGKPITAAAVVAYQT